MADLGSEAVDRTVLVSRIKASDAKKHFDFCIVRKKLRAYCKYTGALRFVWRKDKQCAWMPHEYHHLTQGMVRVTRHDVTSAFPEVPMEWFSAYINNLVTKCVDRKPHETNTLEGKRKHKHRKRSRHYG